MTDLNKLADELEAQGEGYLRTLKPAWTGENRDEALALIIVVADNLPTILSALRSAGKMREALEEVAHDLTKRARACEGLSHDQTEASLARLTGKRTAYAHAAEIVLAALKTEGE
jgi:hypothetical protein